MEHKLDALTLEEARAGFLALLRRSGFAAGTETVPTAESCGRVTAGAIYARMSSPHFPASAMDGIAIAARCTVTASENSPLTLQKGEFTVVDTGDPIPEGCDTVVMIENVENNADGSVTLRSPTAPWQNIRQIGEDICAGDMLLGSCRVITPAGVGALLAAGVLSVSVLRIPRVGIIPSGDEIVPPGEALRPGELPEFNSAIFSGLLRQWGAEPIVYPIVPDRLPAIRAAVENAVRECDMVILNAGSSAGREDWSERVLFEVGERFCHGLAIKPGKPTILAAAGKKPLLGVPGYPVAGILVLENLLKPLLDCWYGRCAEPGTVVEAELTRALRSKAAFHEFVRLRLSYMNGRWLASPLGRGSSSVSAFMRSDGLAEIPQGVALCESGSRLSVTLLRSEAELRNTLQICGSHDPLIDELSDLLHRADVRFSLRSENVGSMSGLQAVKRGEAHAAGIHLLQEDGGYNTERVSRSFPTGGVRMVECVYRQQGLLLQKGNPLGITGIRDLARPNVRYVNRQQGSGTRLLLDRLLREAGLSPADVRGYEREECTHTAVAAQIAAGSADAGLGTYAAAGLYDLDFLPLCREQYDLLIPDSVWESEAVQTLLRVLGSAEFAARLNALGGYEPDTPGRVREHF